MKISREPRPKVIAVVCGLLITCLHIVWWFSNSPTLGDLRDRLNWFIYDTRFVNTLEANQQASDFVALVDLDEASLAEQGRWPWPRVVFAELIQKIADAGAVVIALDIMFTDADTNPVDLIMQTGEQLGQSIQADTRAELERLRPALDGDTAIANVLRNNDVVVGFSFNEESTDKTSRPTPSRILNDLDLLNYPIPKAPGILANVAVINDAARFQGFFSIQEDPDGVLRRYHLFYQFENVIYPSLALEALRVYNLLDGLEVDAEGGNLQRIRVGGLEIPSDNEARTLIPFMGQAGAVQSYSATDVLNDRLEPGSLEGKIIFVGLTAKSQSDFISTPVQPNFPGLEVHATIASAIMTGQWKYREGVFENAGLALILLVGIFMSLTLPFIKPVYSVAGSFAISALVIVSNIWLWSAFDIDFDMAIALILTLVLTIFNVAYGFIHESMAKQQITGMFGQYVPPALVKQLSDQPDSALSFDGDRREMTVLFADIRNFTSISEGMEPGELKDMLNRYFTPMTQIIFEQQGTIDKYIGDMVMAFWGAPLEDKNHAVHALTAAMQMQAKTRDLKPELKSRGYPEIKIGIGLNSGDMNVGNMGSEYRRSYTVLGDNVNLGSRVEGLTKFYGAEILVGENTFNLTRDHFVFRMVDRVQVKGKEEAVALYEPLGLKGDVSDQVLTELAELAEYESALADYMNRDWKRASSKFTSLFFANQQSLLYKLYRDRVTDHEVPEEGWDGVFRHTSK